MDFSPSTFKIQLLVVSKNSFQLKNTCLFTF
jgi:hypothetical protein